MGTTAVEMEEGVARESGWGLDEGPVCADGQNCLWGVRLVLFSYTAEEFLTH